MTQRTEIPSGIPDWRGARCPYCNIGRLIWNSAKNRYYCPRCHPTEENAR